MPTHRMKRHQFLPSGKPSKSSRFCHREKNHSMNLYPLLSFNSLQSAATTAQGVQPFLNVVISILYAHTNVYNASIHVHKLIIMLSAFYKSSQRCICVFFFLFLHSLTFHLQMISINRDEFRNCSVTWNQLSQLGLLRNPTIIRYNSNLSFP